MSGGYFDYKQVNIDYIIDELEEVINKNGKLKTQEELKEESWHDYDWYKKYPEDLYHKKYSDETINEFKNGLNYLKLASIYCRRIDYLLSGDDGEESFRNRLEEALKEFKNDEKNN